MGDVREAEHEQGEVAGHVTGDVREAAWVMGHVMDAERY